MDHGNSVIQQHIVSRHDKLGGPTMDRKNFHAKRAIWFDTVLFSLKIQAVVRHTQAWKIVIYTGLVTNTPCLG